MKDRWSKEEQDRWILGYREGCSGHRDRNGSRWTFTNLVGLIWYGVLEIWREIDHRYLS